jgi:hypothetical protein
MTLKLSFQVAGSSETASPANSSSRLFTQRLARYYKYSPGLYHNIGICRCLPRSFSFTSNLLGIGCVLSLKGALLVFVTEG